MLMIKKTIHYVVALLLGFALTQCNSTKHEIVEADSNVAKVFVVLDISVKDSLMYEQYRSGVEKVIKEYGGKYLVRSGGKAFDPDPDRLVIHGEGQWNPDRFIIIQWNSMEQLQKFSQSKQYQDIARFRKNAASSKSIIVKEYLQN